MELDSPAVVVHQDEPGAPTRRGMLGRVALIAATLGVAVLPDLNAAGKGKKGKHKKRKKRRQRETPPPQPPQPPIVQPETCEERCHDSCARCFHRPEGTPLCASQGASFCAYHCTTDSNCVGTGHPYCTTGQFHFASGTMQVWDGCLNGNTSICTDVEPCG